MGENHVRKIISFYLRRRRMPSYSEIMAATGIRSKLTVFRLVENMKERGIVNKDRAGRLIPGRRFTEIPLVGTVHAGFPSPAEEELTDTMSLDEYLMPNKDATYLFRVTGDSMIEAGIMDGDMALVERGRTPKDGDIVLAEVDREWTMKYYRKNGAKVWLEPANKKYKPIYPKEILTIPAVVISVIRRYHL
jgi:repressor LexA